MTLEGKKVALLVEDVYEDLEFWYPYYRLKEAGCEVEVLGAGKDAYESKHGYVAKVDQAVDDVSAGDFDGVIIPGGYSPDKMRRHEPMVDFVRQMHRDGKVVAAICHAGWMLASAGILEDKRATSFFSIKDDMLNAGCDWVDEAVVKDDNIITSRNPDDLPAFLPAILGALAEQ